MIVTLLQMLIFQTLLILKCQTSLRRELHMVSRKNDYFVTIHHYKQSDNITSIKCNDSHK